MLQDEEGLKELRKRMWWIREAEVEEGVGYQKMAEFVINTGDRHRKARQEQEPQQYDRSGKHGHAYRCIGREPFGIFLQHGTPKEQAGQQ